MSVEEMGEMLKYKKLEMPKKIKKPIELAEYCMRDTEIVYITDVNLRFNYA